MILLICNVWSLIVFAAMIAELFGLLKLKEPGNWILQLAMTQALLAAMDARCGFTLGAVIFITASALHALLAWWKKQ